RSLAQIFVPSPQDRHPSPKYRQILHRRHIAILASPPSRAPAEKAAADARMEERVRGVEAAMRRNAANKERASAAEHHPSGGAGVVGARGPQRPRPGRCSAGGGGDRGERAAGVPPVAARGGRRGGEACCCRRGATT
ncbi:unnamed protein product, partial [Urochloa humidicola]